MNKRKKYAFNSKHWRSRQIVTALYYLFYVWSLVVFCTDAQKWEPFYIDLESITIFVLLPSFHMILCFIFAFSLYYKMYSWAIFYENDNQFTKVLPAEFKSRCL